MALFRDLWLEKTPVLRNVVVVLLLALLGAACSGGSALEEQAQDDGSESGVAEDDSSDTADAASTDGDSPDRLAAVASGTLRLGMLSDIPAGPRSASPVDAGQLMVADLLADGLTSLDRAGVAVPALAESWESNEDATSWTFSLRPDARFSDGSLITADDVKQSLEAVAIDTDLLASDALSSIVGFDEVTERNQLSGLIAVDDVTLRIDLVTPVRYLDQLLAMPALGVAADNRADTSGPWAVKSRSADLLVLAHDSAHDDEAGPDDPDGQIDTIEVHRLADGDAAQRAFDDGQFDLIWLGIGVPSRGATYFDGHVTAFLGSRLTSDVVGDAGLRSKLEASIDRQTIVSSVFGDAAQPLWGLVPAGLTDDPITCVRDCFDRDLATEALAERLAEEGQRPQVALDHPSGIWQTELATSVAADLETVGLGVDLNSNSKVQMKAALNSDDLELFLIGTVAQSSAPEAYLLSLFGTEASQNLTGYDNPVVDALAEVDGSSVARAEQAILADDPVFPLAQFNHSVLLGPRAQTAELHLDGTILLERLKLGAG